MLLLMSRGAARARFHVITHRRVPPNDGGIALGQLLVGKFGDRKGGMPMCLAVPGKI